MMVVYIDGEYVAKDQARISIFDFGFLRGDAVFGDSPTRGRKGESDGR